MSNEEIDVMSLPIKQLEGLSRQLSTVSLTWVAACVCGLRRSKACGAVDE
jgi:hypothetical protein